MDGMKAKGIARRILGDTITVVLKFESPIHALEAVRSLGIGWEQSSKSRSCLAWIGTKEEFEPVEKFLFTLGANNLSVLNRDGERFSIEVPRFPSTFPKVLLKII